MQRKCMKYKIASGGQLYLVLVIGGGRASFQVADLTVLVSNNERPLKLQQQALHSLEYHYYAIFDSVTF